LAASRKGTNNKYEFKFDRVFSPAASQAEVFEEISQLVQVRLDYLSLDMQPMIVRFGV